MGAAGGAVGERGGAVWGIGLLALLASRSALAQENLDAHGVVPAPSDGDPLDPVQAWRPESMDGVRSFSAVGEYGKGLLLRNVQVTPDQIDTEPLLDGLVGLNLGGAYGVNERIGVAAALPVWFRSVGADGAQGPALGDLQLWAPIGLLVPGSDGGLGISAVPTLKLPTGAGGRALGDAGVSGGLLLAGSYGAGPFSATVNAGLERRAWDAFQNVVGGGALRGGLALGFAPAPNLGVSGEITYANGLRAGPDGLPDAGAAVEALLGVRGRTPTGLTWQVGGGRGITEGVGTSALRVYAGVGWSKPTADGPSLDAVGPVVFHVVDENGAAVRGAAVEIGKRAAGSTDADGKLSVADVGWRKGVLVRADGYVPKSVEQAAGEVQVVLDWAPIPVKLTVRDQTGAAVPAQVSVLGEGEVPAPVVADGQSSFELSAGTWTVVTTAPGLGRQERTVVVEPGRRAPVVIESLLAPDQGDGAVALSVVDIEGKPIDQARVLVDGRPDGTTSTGGTLEVGDLAEGNHRVEVSAEGFQTVEARDLAVTNGGEVAQKLVLQRVPGSVKVVARGPNGKIVDATVRFDGPSRLQAQPLGDYGERIFVLRPGTWQVLVASPTYGLQQRELVVPEDDTRLLVVEVVLQPGEEGTADLTVRVVDPDGRAIEGAEILLDDKPMGLTATGGSVALQDLDTGPRKLAVSAAHMRPVEPADLMLIEGLQERVVTLAWEPGTVKVTARTPESQVPDATARFSGPGAVSPLPLGGDGVEFTSLANGSWAVLVASPTYGLQQRQVLVPQDSRSLLEVDVVMNAPEGGAADLTVQVVGPDGKPVGGALVTLDGVPLGATASAGNITLQQLDAGQRTLQVRSSLYGAKSQRVSLKNGAQTATVTLDWAPGATKIVTKSGGAPVTDAIVRLAGPSVLAPTPVDAGGERLFALTPGKWTALVVSPTYGLQQQEVTVAEGAKGLQIVTFDLQPVGAGEAELLVRVQDPDGKPVPGAEVKLAGAAKGSTGSGGTLLLGSLAAGDLALEISAKSFQARTVAGVKIAEGSQERIVTLDWEPRTVTVRVLDEAKQPVDAQVRFDGPADVAPKQVGADGVEEFQLRPGKWQIVASTGALGAKAKEITLAPGAAPQTIELTLRAAKVGVGEGVVSITEQVPFDLNSAVLRPEAAAILDEVAATLVAHPEIAKVEVQGHTDDTGTVERNYELSRERAAAVVDALVKRGVAPERLVPQGYGPTRPLSPNADDAARAQNRRVQFEIAETAAE